MARSTIARDDQPNPELLRARQSWQASRHLGAIFVKTETDDTPSAGDGLKSEMRRQEWADVRGHPDFLKLKAEDKQDLKDPGCLELVTLIFENSARASEPEPADVLPC